MFGVFQRLHVLGDHVQVLDECFERNFGRSGYSGVGFVGVHFDFGSVFTQRVFREKAVAYGDLYYSAV